MPELLPLVKIAEGYLEACEEMGVEAEELVKLGIPVTVDIVRNHSRSFNGGLLDRRDVSAVVAEGRGFMDLAGGRESLFAPCDADGAAAGGVEDDLPAVASGADAVVLAQQRRRRGAVGAEHVKEHVVGGGRGRADLDAPAAGACWPAGTPGRRRRSPEPSR